MKIPVNVLKAVASIDLVNDFLVSKEGEINHVDPAHVTLVRMNLPYSFNFDWNFMRNRVKKFLMSVEETEVELLITNEEVIFSTPSSIMSYDRNEDSHKNKAKGDWDSPFTLFHTADQFYKEMCAIDHVSQSVMFKRMEPEKVVITSEHGVHYIKQDVIDSDEFNFVRFSTDYMKPLTAMIKRFCNALKSKPVLRIELRDAYPIKMVTRTDLGDLIVLCAPRCE
jgi:hypothetical protein